jgi:phosphoglycerol transferase MdoB-like AlkP superfamily enzyme
MRTLLNKLREFKGANIVLFVVFATTIYLQCCFFHESLVLPGGKVLTPYMLVFKASIAISIASLIFLFKHKSWTIVVSILINMWGISNMMYQRANGILIDAYSITMVGNMDGFWGSVPFYMRGSDFYIFYTSLIVIISYILFRNKNRNLSNGLIGIVLGICVHIFGYEMRVRSHNAYKPFLEEKFYNPYSLEKMHFACWDLYDNAHYTRETSIIHHFIYQTHFFFSKIVFPETYTLTDVEANQARQFIKPNNKNVIPERPLYIIVVESLENWVINPYSMPNLYQFIQKENILFAPNLKCQTRGGTSADGQMIINTGLLPTKEGAVCFRFPRNTFPSLSKLYETSFNVIPGGQTVWNQSLMNTAYGIKDNFDGSLNDKDLIEQFIEKYNKYDYGMMLTMSTHSPFNAYAHLSSLSIPAGAPTSFSNYLKSFNYTDQCLATLFSAIESNEKLKNSTVVITADHTVFNKELRDSFNDFCKQNNLSLSITSEGYCPLIIYSPNIEGNKVVNETAYQMDIFPTILNVIGCEDYYWNGFGINLLEKDTNNRKIEDYPALELSDKLHQANYFKSIEQE